MKSMAIPAKATGLLEGIRSAQIATIAAKCAAKTHAFVSTHPETPMIARMMGVIALAVFVARYAYTTLG